MTEATDFMSVVSYFATLKVAKLVLAANLKTEVRVKGEGARLLILDK